MKKPLTVILSCFLTLSCSLPALPQNADIFREAYQKTINSYPQELAEARKAGERSREVQIYYNAATAYQYFGEHQKAIELYRQALPIALSIPDEVNRSMVVSILSGLGATYSKLGDYRGINFFEGELKQARAKGDRVLIRAILKNLSSAYFTLPDYPKAILAYEEYLSIVQTEKDRFEEALTLGYLSNVYLNAGDLTKTITISQQLLAVASEIENPEFKKSALRSLSFAYQSQGNLPQAIAYEEQILSIDQQSKDSSALIGDLMQLASLYGKAGNAEKLISLLEQSLAIAQSTNRHPIEQVTPLNALSRAYALVGNLPKAIDLQKQSLSIVRNDRTTSFLDLMEVSALENLGILQFKSGQFAESEHNLQAAIVASSQISQDLLNISNSAPWSRDDQNLNNREFIAGADIYRTLQQVLVATNRSNQALEVAEAGRARAIVDLLTLNLGTDPKSFSVAAPSSLEQMRQIAKAQNSTLVQYSVIYNDKVFSWVKLGEQRVYETTLYIWVIKPTGEIIFRQKDLRPFLQQVQAANPETSLLSTLVINARNSIFVRGRGTTAQETEVIAPTSDRSVKRTSDPHLQKLHQILIEPIADLLPSDPKQRVTFIPQDSLFLVPFSALQDANGNYLLEKHTILMAPSIQVLDLTHQQRQHLRSSLPQNILVVGNPVMPTYQPKPGESPLQLPSLPGSEKEANAIASLFKTQPLTGPQATETAVTQQMSNSRLIHLATHGLFDNLGGFQSSLAFTPDRQTDGFLTAREVINLKLKAELVVLSACDTGRGKISGDGVIGLSRSFMAAGVPSVVVSLWKVPDEPTAELMVSFYQNLQQTPDKARALRQAMLATLEKYPNPRNWAAFTLVGEAE